MAVANEQPFETNYRLTYLRETRRHFIQVYCVYHNWISTIVANKLSKIAVQLLNRNISYSRRLKIHNITTVYCKVAVEVTAVRMHICRMTETSTKTNYYYYKSRKTDGHI